MTGSQFIMLHLARVHLSHFVSFTLNESPDRGGRHYHWTTIRGTDCMTSARPDHFKFSMNLCNPVFLRRQPLILNDAGWVRIFVGSEVIANGDLAAAWQGLAA
jgi:hypothetical protein